MSVEVPDGINLQAVTNMSDLGGGIRRLVVEGVMIPQPDWERFWISLIAVGPPGSEPFAWIDNVYIGTQCVPEPASLGVLAIGAGFLIRRRRR